MGTTLRRLRLTGPRKESGHIRATVLILAALVLAGCASVPKMPIESIEPDTWRFQRSALVPGPGPQKRSTAMWSPANDPRVQMGPVPEGCTWDVRAAGVATDYGGEGEYMLELITLADTGACCFRVPVARAYAARGTPALALSRELEMRSGEWLAARAWLRGVETKGYKIALVATYTETCGQKCGDSVCKQGERCVLRETSPPQAVCVSEAK